MTEDRERELVTQILQEAENGDVGAASRLLPLLYNELRRLAGARMAQMPAQYTLQPTELVHEAYLRLVGQNPDGWNSRGHFFGAASKAMWQILVERARKKSSQKGGGGAPHESLDDIELGLGDLSSGRPVDDILALDSALDELGRDSRKTQVVLLRYVAGLSAPETAEALDVSLSTVESDWRYARLFLYKRLSDSD